MNYSSSFEGIPFNWDSRESFVEGRKFDVDLEREGVG
jgi:hypothetical protein